MPPLALDIILRENGADETLAQVRSGGVELSMGTESAAIGVDVVAEEPLDDLAARLMGQSSFSTFDLTVTGAHDANFLSRVMGGFKYSLNADVDENGDAIPDSSGCDSNITEQRLAAPRQLVSVALASDETSIDATLELDLRYYPLEFRISSGEINATFVGNKTLPEDHPDQAWSAVMRMGEFQLLPTDLERVTPDHKNNMFFKLSIQARDKGDALRGTIMDAAAGRSAPITIIKGGVAETKSVVFSREEQGKIFVDLDAGSFFKVRNSTNSTNGTAAAATNSSAAPEVKLSRIDFLAIDTENTTLDMACILQSHCALRSARAGGEMKKERLKIDAVTVIEIGLKLPLDVNLALPVINVEVEEVTKNKTSDKETVKIVATIELDGLSYELDESGTGNFITNEQVRLPDVVLAVDLASAISAENKNLTIRGHTTNSIGASLFDSLLSEFVFEAAYVEKVKTAASNTTGNASGNSSGSANATNATSTPSSTESSIGINRDKPADISLNMSSVSDRVALSLSAAFDVEGLAFTVGVAALNVTVFSKGSHGTIDSLTPAGDGVLLEDCAKTRGSANTGLVPACRLAVVSWPHITFSSTQRSLIAMGLDLISPDGLGMLLGEVGTEVLNGGLVGFEIAGKMSTPANAGVVDPGDRPVSVRMINPSLAFSSLGDPETAVEAVDAAADATKKRVEGVSDVYIRGFGTDGTTADLPCIMGSEEGRCEGLEARAMMDWEMGVRLNEALPDYINLDIKVPKLVAKCDIILSDSPSVASQLGTLSVDEFSYGGIQSNNTVYVRQQVVLSSARVARSLAKAINRETQNITARLGGAPVPAPGMAGPGVKEASMLQRILSHLSYNLSFTPKEYGVVNTAIENTKEGLKERSDEKSVASVLSITFGTTMDAVTFNGDLDMGASDYPAPFIVRADGMVMEISTGAAKAATLTIPAFSLDPDEGGKVSMNVVSYGASELASARTIVHEMRYNDRVQMEMKGTVLPDGTVDASAVVGAANVSKLVASVENATEIGLDEMHMVGGKTAGSPVRIPCILEEICPFLIPAVDEKTDFTLWLGFTASIPGLPMAVVVDISDGILAMALDDTTHNTIFKASLPAFHFDSRLPPQYKTLLYASIDSATRLRTVIQTLFDSNIDYRFHVYGDTTKNALGSLWVGEDAVVIEVPASEETVTVPKDPNDFTDDWFYPLAETNTWKIKRTTATEARFRLPFEIAWPVPVAIFIKQLEIKITYQLGVKPKVTIASITLRDVVTDAVADLTLGANSTKEANSFDAEIALLTDDANAEQYCGKDPLTNKDLEYASKKQCALGDLAFNLLGQEKGTVFGVEMGYGMPPNVPGMPAGGSRVAITLDLQLFDKFWATDWDRTQTEYMINKWNVLPPGPPRGTGERKTK